MLPWFALKEYGAGVNPFGNNPTFGSWPVSLSIGDIDNDGRIDHLLP